MPSALIAVAAAGVVLAAFCLRAPPLPWPACLFRLVTGAPCPSCGLTHGFIALAHGDLPQAVHDNLMTPALFLALALAGVLAAFDAVAGRSLLRRLWRRRKRTIVGATLLLALVSWTWNIYKSAVAG